MIINKARAGLTALAAAASVMANQARRGLIMIRYRCAVAAVAALALTGATLGIATPAFAKPALTKVVTTTTIGNKPGAGCPLDPGHTAPDGTTVTQVFTFSDGSQTKSTSECRNGGWFATRVVNPYLIVPLAPSPVPSIV